MSGKTWSHGLLRAFVIGASAIGLAVFTVNGSHPAAAQATRTAAAMQATSGGDAASRGKYIVEDVAMCGNCHTPRLSNGQLDRTRWLAGASNPYLPAQPRSDWPINVPRLAGTPPTTDAGMITLLTTAVWIDGKPLDDPMPHFHMTRADAEAVVAYLRSLR